MGDKILKSNEVTQEAKYKKNRKGKARKQAENNTDPFLKQ